MFTVLPYSATFKSIWDAFVLDSLNGTFMLQRNYMEYHSMRFRDCSVLIVEEELAPELILKNPSKVKALFPANHDVSAKTVHSHQGLTFGGLIIKENATQLEVNDMVSALVNHFKKLEDVEVLRIKPIPYIYNKVVNDAENYAWYSVGARLENRNVSTVIEQRSPLKMSTLRRRKIKLAEKNRVEIVDCPVNDFDHLDAYWRLLKDVLRERHNARPVHSFEEMMLLMSYFPNNIHLHLAEKDGQLLAGVLVYESSQVAHVQYIASGETGRQTGALDFLMNHLIKEVYTHKAFFDMGRSMADNGEGLNEGLVFQKEGFGGRTVCYDSYVVQIGSDK